MVPFYGWEFNCLNATDTLREGSLLFTTKFFISNLWEDSKMFKITSKHFSILTNMPPTR